MVQLLPEVPLSVRPRRKDQRIFLRSFFSARNLLLANKKTTATSGGLFAGSRATNSFSEGNWLQQSADTKYCSSSVAVVRPPLQELCSTAYILALLILLPVAAASGDKSCLTGLDSRR
ncbi:hypothetical protein B7764_22120 (plasmid) [Pantoea ananatis]|nr:hypothetical protein B7764_22120 [Pantoea ananatis]